MPEMMLEEAHHPQHCAQHEGNSRQKQKMRVSCTKHTVFGINVRQAFLKCDLDKDEMSMQI